MEIPQHWHEDFTDHLWNLYPDDLLNDGLHKNTCTVLVHLRTGVMTLVVAEPAYAA